MVNDRNGKTIEIGSYVKYINTGTRGIVKSIKKEKEKEWVLLDNEVMYNPILLEILDISKIDTDKDEDKDELVKKIEGEEIDLTSGGGEGCCGAG